MGAVGTSFARNLPVAPTRGGPAPALVSEALLKRRQFVPATSLNMLAAAWLQFEVHDWFAHQVQADAEPLPIGLQPLKRDGASTPNLPVFLSDQGHWWDASQLYGADPCFANAVRSADSHKIRPARSASMSSCCRSSRPSRPAARTPSAAIISTRPARYRTCGSAWRSITSSSHASTTRCVIACTRPTRSGPDSASMTRPG